MGISLEQIPAFDGASFYSDRWVFQLSEPLNGHHGGTYFVDGLATEPVDTRCFRKFVCGFGHKMVGALRVEGGHYEVGDCGALLPPKAEPKHVEIVPAAGELAPVHTHRDSIPPPAQREFDTDQETPKAKAKHHR